jgi:hypothetical protein
MEDPERVRCSCRRVFVMQTENVYVRYSAVYQFDFGHLLISHPVTLLDQTLVGYFEIPGYGH